MPLQLEEHQRRFSLDGKRSSALEMGHRRRQSEGRQNLRYL